MVTFARNRKFSASALSRLKIKARFVPWEQMVHKAYVQKSTVFALKTRGQFRKPAVFAVL